MHCNPVVIDLNPPFSLLAILQLDLQDQQLYKARIIALKLVRSVPFSPNSRPPRSFNIQFETAIFLGKKEIKTLTHCVMILGRKT